ncbi:MAG: inositol monophosphatase [Bacteroidetes bacterium]|nr:inositol monophosphatase [Bacteroidota bacterium]
MKPEAVCKKVCIAVKKAGKFIRNNTGKISSGDVKTKGVHDYVTYVDRTTEQLLVRELKPIMPGSGFLTEEKTVKTGQREFTWIIDPLDGTTNFIHGVPCFSVSVALMKGGSLLAGVVYEINLDECFYAWKGGGAYLNGRRIHVSGTKKITDSLLATGFPFYDYSRLDGYMELFRYFMKNTHGLRRLGSAAVDLAWVACGRMDGFYEYGLKAWDVAAGAFLVKEAGGEVCDFKGKENYLNGGEIIASNREINKEFKRIVAKYL